MLISETVFITLGIFSVVSSIVRPIVLITLGDDLVLVIGVVALTLFIGVLTSWFIVFYDVPFKKLISMLLVLPIAIPPYAVAYCYADITDKGGVLFSFLEFLMLQD